MDKKLMKSMLKTREARIFLYNLMWTSRAFSHGFVPGDPHATAFHEGQRSIGLYLFDLVMQVSPDAFCQMRREWQEEYKADKDRGVN
ncbi:MAG: hypothetical protein PUC11_04220 [Elusimicrobia bacterium]|nr:hypothetical protein [Elusimicrobiota bacterium]